MFIVQKTKNRMFCKSNAVIASDLHIYSCNFSHRGQYHTHKNGHLKRPLARALTFAFVLVNSLALVTTSYKSYNSFSWLSNFWLLCQWWLLSNWLFDKKLLSSWLFDKKLLSNWLFDKKLLSNWLLLDNLLHGNWWITPPGVITSM